MSTHDQMPKYHELMNPLLKALHDLGGSGSIAEISAQVSDNLDLPEMYDRNLFSEKSEMIFQHVYDKYYGAGKSVYSFSA
ncbi:MAG: hypothetical protein KAR44_12545 [Candidatus Aegiribacteria sp.]|nr:hypothetical protein [Candidatus Aegiribacteria sp.]